MSHRLSKSFILSGRQCLKRLYLRGYQPEVGRQSIQGAYSKTLDPQASENRSRKLPDEPLQYRKLDTPALVTVAHSFMGGILSEDLS